MWLRVWTRLVNAVFSEASTRFRNESQLQWRSAQYVERKTETHTERAVQHPVATFTNAASQPQPALPGPCCVRSCLPSSSLSITRILTANINNAEYKNLIMVLWNMNLIDEIELYLYDSCNVFIILASLLNYATSLRKEDGPEKITQELQQFCEHLEKLYFFNEK